MGHKVNPHGLRVGVIKNWDSNWYAKKNEMGDLIVEDYNIRKFLKKKLFEAGLSKTEIERTPSGDVRVKLHVAKPGMVIGRGGEQIAVLEIRVIAEVDDFFMLVYAKLCLEIFQPLEIVKAIELTDRL